MEGFKADDDTKRRLDEVFASVEDVEGFKADDRVRATTSSGRKVVGTVYRVYDVPFPIVVFYNDDAEWGWFLPEELEHLV